MRTTKFAEALRAIGICILVNVLYLSMLTFFLGDIDFPNGNKTVYTTRTGECYHLAHCSNLTSQKNKTTISKATQNGYWSCSYCDAPILKEDGPLFNTTYYFLIVPVAAFFAHIGSIEALSLDPRRPFLLYLAHLAISLLLSFTFDLIF